jgi:hypothetical protein
VLSRAPALRAEPSELSGASRRLSVLSAVSVSHIEDDGRPSVPRAKPVGLSSMSLRLCGETNSREVSE